MRYYLYALSGLLFSLIGWNVSQLILLGAGNQVGDGIPLPTSFSPDFLLLPLAASLIAIAMVATEIFTSNPTRYKSNRRVLPAYLLAAFVAGLVSGLIAASISWLLYKFSFPSSLVRIISWGLIGLLTGLGEGTSWRFRSIEGGTQRANQRVLKSTVFGLLAGFVAAIFIELLRRLVSLGGYEDPVGFALLGVSLGLFLSFAAAPTYQVALRAGEGFEAIDPRFNENDQRDRPRLNPQHGIDLSFVSWDDYDYIEEGLSIRLPGSRNGKARKILIGSATDSDIYIPNIPKIAASLLCKGQNYYLRCLSEGALQIQSRRLTEGSRPVPLRHNQIITIFHARDPDRFYRFVFYDRFLDPEA